MNTKQHKTLTAIFTSPTLSSILWNDIENLILALEGEIRHKKIFY